jgi:hypothetical protein
VVDFLYIGFFICIFTWYFHIFPVPVIVKNLSGIFDEGLHILSSQVVSLYSKKGYIILLTVLLFMKLIKFILNCVQVELLKIVEKEFQEKLESIGMILCQLKLLDSQSLMFLLLIHHKW